jgi:hypothetical protein
MLQEVKVYYKDSDRLNLGFDEELEKLLSKYGLSRWASGFNHIDKIRDLAFDKPRSRK